MKKLLLTTIFFTLFNLLYGQTSSQLLAIQANPPQQVDNPTILGVRLEGSAWRIYAFNKWKIIDTVSKLSTKTDLSLKVNNSRTITINGISYDLSSNRSWDVGDVNTSGSYVNPNWISSLSYSKLTDVPTIPTNNNQLSNGAGYISSFTELDPTVPSYAKSLSAFNVIKDSTDVLYKGIGYSPSSLEISTALGYTPYNGTINPNGYVTSSSLTTTLSGYATSSALTSGLSGKFNSPIGNTSQYLRGDGSLATFPAIPSVSGASGTYGAVTTSNGLVTSGKRLLAYRGTTDASGNYTVVFGTAFPSAPNIQASINNQTSPSQFIRVSNVTTTGFTINVYQRSAVSILSIEVLLAAVTNVSGASVDVLVTEM